MFEIVHVRLVLQGAFLGYVRPHLGVGVLCGYPKEIIYDSSIN